MSIPFMKSIQAARAADEAKNKGFAGINEACLIPENDDNSDNKSNTELNNDSENPKSECDEDKWESLFHSRTQVAESEEKKGEADLYTVGTGSEGPKDDKAELPSGETAKDTVSGNPEDKNMDDKASKDNENPLADVKECFENAHFNESIKDPAKIKAGQIYIINGKEYAFITMKTADKIGAKVVSMSKISLEDLCTMKTSDFLNMASEIVKPVAEFMAYNISGKVNMKEQSIVAEAKMQLFFESIDPEAAIANLDVEYAAADDLDDLDPNEVNIDPENADESVADSVLKAMAGAEKGNTANAGKDGVDTGASSTTQEDPQTTTKTEEKKSECDESELGDWWSKLSEEDKKAAKKFIDTKK